MTPEEMFELLQAGFRAAIAAEREEAYKAGVRDGNAEWIKVRNLASSEAYEDAARVALGKKTYENGSDEAAYWNPCCEQIAAAIRARKP